MSIAWKRNEELTQFCAFVHLTGNHWEKKIYKNCTRNSELFFFFWFFIFHFYFTEEITSNSTKSLKIRENFVCFNFYLSNFVYTQKNETRSMRGKKGTHTHTHTYDYARAHEANNNRHRKTQQNNGKNKKYIKKRRMNDRQCLWIITKIHINYSIIWI